MNLQIYEYYDYLCKIKENELKDKIKEYRNKLINFNCLLYEKEMYRILRASRRKKK